MTLPREGRREGGVHLYPVHVYYEDTDAGGVVYYANYLKFAERGRSEALRALGSPSHDRLREEAGVTLAVHKLAAEYLSPARLDDDLVVRTRVKSVSGASVHLEQEIWRGPDRLFAMTCAIVCIGRNGRPARLPPVLAQALTNADPATLRPALRPATSSSKIPPKTSKVMKAHAR
ncbi:MAG TPA: tol-pal system-associated acyl-CoA thioesterase [Stellaceae bacterium]|nr:tol-pal system-associated acyl-CoA thioesterase [Stellaceae bacterium]